jgi:hypothetical protein
MKPGRGWMRGGGRGGRCVMEMRRWGEWRELREMEVRVRVRVRVRVGRKVL